MVLSSPMPRLYSVALRSTLTIIIKYKKLAIHRTSFTHLVTALYLQMNLNNLKSSLKNHQCPQIASAKH